MLCSQCSASLPEGSQFCLKCGKKLGAPAKSVALATIPVPLKCDGCGGSLPQSAEFCPKCGQPVISSVNGSVLAPALPQEIDTPRVSSSRGHLILPGLLVLLLCGAVLWLATSETPAAQQIDELVSWSHSQTVLDTAFSLSPHSFSSYEFTVPRGALSISINGQFTAAASTTGKGSNRNDRAKDHDADVEVYVLNNAAFAVWSAGYAADAKYESGAVASGSIDAPLPAGVGVYHLIFSNRNSARAKSIHATVLLRYKSWLPDALVRLKEQFWNWLDL